MKITKKAYLLVVLALCVGQIFGQRRMLKTEPSKPQPIELNEIHEMVKNLADSISVNYIDA